jgi:hypothetical protein
MSLPDCGPPDVPVKLCDECRDEFPPDEIDHFDGLCEECAKPRCVDCNRSLFEGGVGICKLTGCLLYRDSKPCENLERSV